MQSEVFARRRAWRWGVGIVAVLAIVGIIVYQIATFLKQPPQRRGRFQDAANQPVGVARVRRGDIRLSLRALGAVTPLTTVTVTTQISGELMSVGFKEGQLVHKGDFLAQIDPRPYQVALDQDRAQWVRDDAALKQAQMDLTRYETLARQVSIPRQTAEDQAWIVKQDQGTVAYDEAQIRAQQLNLTYCHITAPADGRVGLRQVDPGNYLQAGSTTGIVVLTLLRPISVIFAVPEDSLPAITARLQAGATLPVTVFDRANVTQLATGQFAALDTQVDTTTGTVRLRANVDNADERLFPSQFVNVVMLLDTLKDAVTVPVSAVQRGAPGTYVYLVGDGDTVAVHPIKLGAQDGNLFAVESGLNPGDRVVTDGADRLRDGAHVTIPDAAQQARPAGAGRRAPNRGDEGSGPGSADQSDRPHHRRRQRQDGSQQGNGAPQDGSQPAPGAQPNSTQSPGTQRDSQQGSSTQQDSQQSPGRQTRSSQGLGTPPDSRQEPGRQLAPGQAPPTQSPAG